MALPDNEHVFEFEATGDTTGKKYDGQFSCVCVLDMLQKQLIGIEKTKLQADFTNPDPELKGIAHILSNLRVRIIDSPEWWQQSNGGYSIQDENIIVLLYDKVMEGETKWREKLQKMAQKAESAQSAKSAKTSSTALPEEA
jgi:hypothetical protein